MIRFEIGLVASSAAFLLALALSELSTVVIAAVSVFLYEQALDVGMLSKSCSYSIIFEIVTE